MKAPKRLSSSYYRSLNKSLLVIVILVSVAPMIIVSGIVFEQFNHSYHEKVHDHLRVLVKKHKQNIDNFLKEKLNDIRFLSKTVDFEELCDETFLQNKLNSLKKEFGYVFVDLGVIDNEGIQVAYAGPFKLANVNYKDAEWFQQTMKDPPFVSDVFLGYRGSPHFIVAERNTINEKNWILRATIDFDAFNKLVENIRIGETGFAFILNKKGEFQTKPLVDVSPDQKPYKDLFASQKNSPNEVQIMETTDHTGKKNIYSATLLKNGDWILIYQQYISDAFSDLYRTQKIAIAIIFIGCICIISVVYLLSRRMVSQIAFAEREKEMMNQQVIETGKLASLGELAAGIAHEINNPVAIMVEEAGWIEDLLMEEDLKQSKNLEEFERALKQINTQGKRCREITYKLLSFARKTDSTLQKVELNEIVEDVVGLSAQRAKYSNVIISMNLQENLPTMKMSPSGMQQVFLNFINNALDAMDKTGGSLELSTRLQDNNIIIDITDTGPGIPEANLSRIFDPFFTTKPVGKGTGLGLSICYGIITKMGWDIDVKSVIDVGTTFSILIPLQEGVKAKVADVNETENTKKAD